MNMGYRIRIMQCPFIQSNDNLHMAWTVPSFLGTMWSPELHGESDRLQIPAAHMPSKYLFARSLNFLRATNVSEAVLIPEDPDVLM